MSRSQNNQKSKKSIKSPPQIEDNPFDDDDQNPNQNIENNDDDSSIESKKQKKRIKTAQKELSNSNHSDVSSSEKKYYDSNDEENSNNELDDLSNNEDEAYNDNVKQNEDDSYKSSEDEDFSLKKKKKKKTHRRSISNKSKSDRKLNKKRHRGSTSVQKKKIKKPKITDFIEKEAEESDKAEEEEGSDGEIDSEEQKILLAQMEKQKEIYKLRTYQEMDEDKLVDRYENIQNKMLDEDEYLDPNDEIAVKANQPVFKKDPSLWYIKCKLGKEREAVDTLFHKYFCYNKPGQQLNLPIFSVASFDLLKGSIYIEAYREAHVRKAIMGISYLRENSIKIVPLNEMTQVFECDKMQNVELKRDMFVRMKSGLYEGDLAQVVLVEDQVNKIYIRLVPRITESNSNDKIKNLSEYNKKIKKNIKPKQKLFNPSNYSGSEQKILKGFPVYEWNKQYFKNGFLIKCVKLRSLLVDNISPTMEEAKIFSLSFDENENEEENNEGVNNNSINLNNNLVALTRKKIFDKGDRIKMVKGALIGVTGKVASYKDKIVDVYLDVKGLENELYSFPEDYLQKQFLEGESVQIISGPNLGKSGNIVKIDNEEVIIFNEFDMKHYKISIYDIIATRKLQYHTNEFGHNLINSKNNILIGELVKINNSNNICYVLSSNQFSVRLIDNRNKISTVSVRDVFKLPAHKVNGVDAKMNQVTKDDNVKIVSGINKGTKATIKNIYKNTVFLCNNSKFVESNGIFAENINNIEILGSDLLYDAGGNKGGINKKIIPDNIKGLINKIIKIQRGEWKGYSGTVKEVTDKVAMVTLAAKNKVIKVDINDIIGFNGDNGDGNYNGGSNYVAKTPAYYPQGQSPGYNSIEANSFYGP